MAYENTTIKELLEEKVNKCAFLPAIQREYVWSPYQICKLFDSLMSGYPISSFLFWRIREEHKSDWMSYDFIREFDQACPHNTPSNLDGVNRDIYLVLDGQQRITSINIGLRGSYRFFYRKWRKTYLYLNLLWDKPNDSPEELTYQFAFRENDSYDSKLGGKQYWYRVGEILNDEDAEDAKEKLDKWMSGYSEDELKTAKRMIGKLHSVINVSRIINFYEEKSNDYDKVLEIFIRTNTGGKKLEYSDILLSTATAKWKTLNAREEINEFTENINSVGAGYSFDRDFVMKAAMFLTENLPIQYKLSSFTQKNLELIENHWEETKKAIFDTVKLVSTLGIVDKNLVSRLALLPVALYLKNKASKTYLSSSSSVDVLDQTVIQKWLIFCLLKNVTGGSSDSTLTKMRTSIGGEKDSFPYDKINKDLMLTSEFNDYEIDNFLQYKYSSKYSFLILSLMYPGRDWKDRRFNEDHIYPQTEFNKKKLRARGYDDEKIELYLSTYNTICNLELLDDSENKSKNKESFDSWIKTRDEKFKERHMIPEMESYDFDHFLEFADKRKDMMAKKLKSFSF